MFAPHLNLARHGAPLVRDLQRLSACSTVGALGAPGSAAHHHADGVPALGPVRRAATRAICVVLRCARDTSDPTVGVTTLVRWLSRLRAHRFHAFPDETGSLEQA